VASKFRRKRRDHVAAAEAVAPKPIKQKTNPLAQALWEKIDHVRNYRKESMEEMAAHWGVDAKVAVAIRDGVAIGSPELHDRISKWMFERVSFRKARALKPRATQAKAERWPFVSIQIPPGLKFRVEQRAGQLNMSTDAFVHVALERLLQHEPTIVTIRQALDLAEGARVAHLMQASPALKDMLEAEVVVLDELGAVLDEYREPTPERDAQAPFTLQQIHEAPMGQAGPATEVFTSRDEFERYEEIPE
jgi:hypothetical protein